MSNILYKVVKIFLSFVMAIVILGFIVLSVREQMLRKVQVSGILHNEDVDCSVRLKGEVKAKYVFNVIAAKDIDIEEFYINSKQIVEDGQALIKLKTMPKGISQDMITIDSKSSEKGIKSNFLLNSTGECVVKHRVFIDFVNENKFVRAGEIIATYSFYKNNNDLYIECNSEKNQFEEGNLKKVSVDGQNDNISIIKKEQYQDHDIVKFYNASENLMNINATVNIKIEASNTFSAGIPKTAFIQSPYEKNTGYLYLVSKRNSIYGEEYVLSKMECKRKYESNELIDCGDLHIDDDVVGVVMYPTSDLRELQKVQICK